MYQQQEEKAKPCRASSCIELIHENTSFNPTFIHQCFDGERIPGYEPFPSSTVVNNSRSSDDKDKDQQEVYYLKIIIYLSSSCTECCIVLITSQKKATSSPILDQENGGSTHVTKSMSSNSSKRAHNEINTPVIPSQQSSSIQESTSKRVRFAVNNDEDTANGNKEASTNIPTTTARMELKDIVHCLSKALPPITHYTRYETDAQTVESIILPPLNTTIHNEDVTTLPANTTMTKLPYHSTNQKSYEYQPELDRPVGTIIKTHKIEAQQENKFGTEFVLTLGHGQNKNVVNYHHRIQNLALLFIETADGISLDDISNGGSWMVLYLFQKSASSKPTTTTSCNLNDNDVKNKNPTSTTTYTYSLVGYMTLFLFHAPFRKPKPGRICRICQALILPSFQRRGLGKLILETVYELTRGNDSLFSTATSTNNQDDNKNGTDISEYKDILADIVEVNVEDPAPSFVILREKVDYEALFPPKTNGPNDKRPKITQGSKNLIPDHYFEPQSYKTLSEKDTIATATSVKITTRQVQKCYEIYKFQQMHDVLVSIKEKNGHSTISGGLNNATTATTSSTTEIADIEKKFRLMVKRRLNQQHKEEIGACPTKESKKVKLADLYEETEHRYKIILKLL